MLRLVSRIGCPDYRPVSCPVLDDDIAVLRCVHVLVRIVRTAYVRPCQSEKSAGQSTSDGVPANRDCRVQECPKLRFLLAHSLVLVLPDVRHELGLVLHNKDVRKVVRDCGCSLSDGLRQSLIQNGFQDV